ncbi:MAG: MotA/TolQ/ExbB proton channel family protein [Candidatus Eisenbacteria bacterium]|nr:MotA/TolQ/ExbB proton channel family protein [Candidatus Eisenbacteria bacterium]
MSQMLDLIAWFRQGGVFMLPLAVLAVAVLVIATERGWALRHESRWQQRSLVDDLVRHCRAGDYGGAQAICTAVEAPLARVARPVLAAAERGATGPQLQSQLQSVASECAHRVFEPLARRLRPLSTLALGAALIGLAGSAVEISLVVSGPIPGANPALEVVHALNAAAFGLTVALVSLLVHDQLARRLESNWAEVDEMIARLIAVIGNDAEAQSAGGSRWSA